MTLTPGTTLGPYEILGPLGAGGMGEVYRAHDTRLSRNVAIKVLPAAFVADPERRARFEREARVVAALSHPNILAIHDIGESSGQGGTSPSSLYVVTELLEGETLRERLTSGGALGTVGYMSPEQVRGQRVDARTDLFALGAVLYEMLSGQRAFRRDTAPETMTAILRDDPPDLSRTRAEISPALDRVVRHCLEKNPAERFQTARDVAFALDTLAGISSKAPSAESVPIPSSVKRERRFIPVLVTAVLALVLGAVVARSFLSPEATDITFIAKTFDPQFITNARFAPDGETIFFSAAATGSIPRLFVLRPNAVSPEPIGEEGTHLLSVSSKGELAAIVGTVPLGHRLFKGTLARMTMDGAAKPWMENIREADWSPDGSTLAVIRTDDDSERLEYPVGQLLYQVSGGYLSDLRVSPDGKKVAFFEHPVKYDNRGDVKVVDELGKVTTLATGYHTTEGLTWSADGTVFYSAQAHTGTHLELLTVNASGTPQVRPVAPTPGGLMVLDRTSNRRLLVSALDLSVSIRVLVPGESLEREFPWLGMAFFGFLSADHRFLSFTDESPSAGPDYAASIRPVAGGKVVRLGPGTTAGSSPDGRWVPGLSPSGDEVTLYPTGPGEPRRLAKGQLTHFEYFLQWFPDGRALVCGSEPNKASRCYAQDVPDGVPVAITPEGIRSALPSPDSRRLVVTTTQGTTAILTIGDSSAPIEVSGVKSNEYVVAWTNDGRGIVVAGRCRHKCSASISQQASALCFERLRHPTVRALRLSP